MKVYTGKLSYKDTPFFFVFDGEILKLIPENVITNDSIKYEEFIPGVYTYRNSIALEKNTLLGRCYETGKKMIFIFKNGSTLLANKDTFVIRPVAYIIITRERDVISRISYKCQELDLIYPVSQAYSVDFTDNDNNNVIFKAETKSVNDLTTESRDFSFDGQNIKISFSISEAVHTKNNRPLEFASILHFEVENIKDYFLVYRLSCDALKFFQFLCNRNNISFESIELATPLQNGLHEKFAELTLLHDMTPDDYDIIKKRFIPYKDICGFEHILMQEIANKTLYLRHIPDSYRLNSRIDAATFVMITAAFEWEYSNLYPNGFPKKNRVLNAEASARKTIDMIIEQKENDDVDKKELEIYYNFRDEIGSFDSLESKIMHVRNNLSSIVDLFGKYLYKINQIKMSEYNKMGNRIANQRNKYAHGNLSKDFDELSSLDIYFLKMIVYTMQMKKMNIPDKNIKDAINNLFFSGFIITTESKEI